MTPKTDIVITFRSTRSHPNEEYLRECVDSLVQHTPNCYRIIFVDDDSDTIGRAFIEGVADEFPTSLLIRTRLQHWFSRAVNIGLRNTRTEKVLVLNSDTRCEDGWLQELYDVWEIAEQELGRKVGLVGSTLSFEEQRRWAATPDHIMRYVTGHCWLLDMRVMNLVAASRHTPGYVLDVTRKEMAHIHSDVEICNRLNLLGYATVRAFKSRVHHLGGKSWGLDLPALSVITDEYLKRLDTGD